MVTVIKKLFIANRARPDILTFISFMTKRALHLTVEDGKKLNLVVIQPHKEMATTVIMYDMVHTKNRIGVS